MIKHYFLNLFVQTRTCPAGMKATNLSKKGTKELVQKASTEMQNEHIPHTDKDYIVGKIILFCKLVAIQL